jgi:predicted permease
MSLLGRLRSLGKWLFRRKSVEKELDAEVQAFYEVIVQRHMDGGLSELEARRLARLDFDSPENAKEQVRDASPGASLWSAGRDIDYSWRRLRKSPAFALVTILTLALGIGANATIFSMVSRFVLRAAPVGNPATLVSIHTTHHGECCSNFSWPLFEDLKDQAKSFSGVAGYEELVPASMSGNGEPLRVWGQATTANFFDVAELGMTVGRGFRAEEEHSPVVVLGYGLWQQRFGGDPLIAGKAILLSGKPFTVIGVAPAGFHGVFQMLYCEFWVPLGSMDILSPKAIDYAMRDNHWLAVIGRLNAGVQSSQANAELKILAQRIVKAHPDGNFDDGFHFERAGSLPPRDRSAVILFLTALSLVALMVLGIAGANVGNLFLVQAAGRQREFAIRLALGATRRHLLNQMLVESVILSLVGGFAGVALSVWATRALAAFRFPAPVPLDLTVSVDGRVVLYSFVLSLVTGILFGLFPAWTVVRPIIASGMKGEDQLGRPGRFWSLGNVLVVSQIAMSVVLLCSTGLFLRSLQNASQIDIGFRSSGVLMMAVDPRLHGYTPERTTQFLNQLRDRASHLPGVVSATYTDSIPISGGNRSDGVNVVGSPDADKRSVGTELYMIGPDYFETIGTTFVAGHAFANESQNGVKFAVVNQTLVEKLFLNQDPIGRQVGDNGVVYQITGVVKNVKSRFLGEDYRPVLYRSLAQTIASEPSFAGYRIVVQFDRDSAGVAQAVRSEIHSLDPTLAIFDAQTMREHLRDALFLPRLASSVFGSFGFLGLVLAAVGLYGVMNSWVSRHTREMGIRLALGAGVAEVQWLIVRRGMLLTVVAIVPGLMAAWAVAKLFTSVLYGVRPHDLPTFALAPIFLALVSVIACWIPARRAAGTEPLEALRHE